MIDLKHIPTDQDNIAYETIKRNNKYGIIDRNGNIIIEPVFDYIFIGEDYIEFQLKGSGEAVWPLSRINELK